MKNKNITRRQLLTRLTITAGGTLLPSCAGVSLGPGLRPSFLIRPEMMMKRISPYFPLKRSYHSLAEIGFANPVFTMAPESNKVRVGLTTAAKIIGLGNFRGGQTSGRCQLACGLRYDPKTRNIFLKDTTLEDLTLSGVPNNWTSGIRQIANSIGSDILEQHPIYTLQDSFGIGLLKSMNVTQEGIRIGFGI